MSNGRTVLTGTDVRKREKLEALLKAEYDCGVIGEYSVERKRDIVTWKLSSEEEAIRFARICINLGYEYVQRII